MISLVIPFYKKLKEFKLVFPHNSKQLENFDHEIVIVMDHSDEENELLEFIKTQNHNFRFIINRKEHDWRPPCKALNVGIRNSLGDKIIVISPESAFDSTLLKRLIENSEEKSFAVGALKHADLCCIESPADIDTISQNLPFKNNLYYGSICAPKSLFEEVGGYDESLVHWGGDDDNIRARFLLTGAEKVILLNSYMIHFQEGYSSKENKKHPARVDNMEYYRKVCNPNKMIVNDKGWGVDFNEVIYDWAIKKDKL